MRQNEKEAQQLVANLTSLGIAAKVEGRGVHWHVDVNPINNRLLRVHCFWYEKKVSDLMLSMNPANSRSRFSPRPKSHEGPEFYVKIEESGQPIADGRTYFVGQVVKCIQSWMSGKPLENVIQETPFINEKLREMKAIAASLAPSLRWDIGDDPGFDLWVYGHGRSCCVRNKTCAFYFGLAQVAFAPQSSNLANDIAAWLIEELPIKSLATRNIQVEQYADVLEVDPARWHWLHIRDRIRNPNDALFDLAPLIIRLLESRIASRFYTYSSLTRLCFSASSHYPWVGKYPVVWAVNSDEYMVDTKKYSLDEAVTKIETVLESSSIEPFFGSESEYKLDLVAKSLEQHGSMLRPKRIQRKLSSDIWLCRNSRRCRIGIYITCFDGMAQLDLQYKTIEDVVSIAIRFLEKGVSLDELDANP